MNKNKEAKVFKIKFQINVLIISMVVLSMLIVGWNFGLVATNPNDDSNYTMNQRSEPRSRGNGGLIWSQIEVLSEPIIGQNFNTGGSKTPQIAVENGKIYVVWRDSNNTNGAGTDTDIFFRCNLTGTFWEPVQVISEPVPGYNFNIEPSHWPVIAVENGRIYVVWYDWNNTNGAGTSDLDIFYRCNITSYSWESIEVISEPVEGQNLNTGNSGAPAIAVGNGKIHIVWEDDNNTNGAGIDQDIFYRSKSDRSLFLRSPKVTPNSGTTSTEFNFTVIYHQLNNTPPTRMKVIIDSVVYSMSEVNPTDTNYTNGKKYYFNMKNFKIGTNNYEFNASDGINFTNTKQSRNFKVVNTVPQIVTEDNLTAIEDEYYETDYEYEDIDIANVGQICHWEFATNANWLNFNLITGELYGTPGNDEVGEYWVYIAANDTMDIVFTNFTLTVVDVNDHPIITTNDVLQTDEDKLYEVDYNATDDRPADLLEWFIESNASWLSIDTVNGVSSGTPTLDHGGKSYWVNVSVRDLQFGLDFHNFTLKVLKEPKVVIKNNIPGLMNFKLSPAEGDNDTKFTFSVTYVDEDDDPPDFIKVLIDEVAFDMNLRSGNLPHYGIYEYVTNLSEGEHSYYFTASDGLDINTSETFTTPNIEKPETLDEIQSSYPTFTIITTFLIVIIIIINIGVVSTEVGKYKFLTLFFVPLYNKLHPDNIFNNFLRGKIYGYISAKPGENYNSIKKALELNNGTLAHHARVLEKEEYIYSKRDGFYTRFYPKGINSQDIDSPQLTEFQQNLIEIIRTQPGITQHELVQFLNASQPDVSYNITKLSRDDMIIVERNGRENRYYLNYEGPKST